MSRNVLANLFLTLVISQELPLLYAYKQKLPKYIRKCNEKKSPEKWITVHLRGTLSTLFIFDL